MKETVPINETNSDDETVVIENRSKKSHNSWETLTEKSQVSMQTKIIVEMQETLALMKEEQQKMKDYIKDLERTVITLINESEDTESYKSAEAKGIKLQKKRKLEIKRPPKQKTNPKEKQEVRRLKWVIKAHQKLFTNMHRKLQIKTDYIALNKNDSGNKIDTDQASNDNTQE